MPDRPPFRLGDLQLRIMKVLWNSGLMSVAAVQARLGDPPLAYTTVATMLRKMERRGLVRHHRLGRRFLYEAAVTAAEVNRQSTADLLDRLFEGSLADAVSHLLEAREVGAEELARLEQLIEQHKKRHATGAS
ncbi:MAG: BlaI/MecI/CopY family transcriptional regulator [Thermoguttaceae bacterium]